MKRKILVPLLALALVVGVLSGCVEEPPTPPENNAPEASFTYTLENMTATFTDTSTDADANDTLTYSWDFGDDETATAQHPTHTYIANGSYIVVLTVSDGTATDTAQETLIVGNVAPTVDFIYAATNLSVNFTSDAADLNDDILIYAWDFDDANATSNETNPSYTYAAAGTYNITLTVTDAYDLSANITKAVTVTE